MSTKARVKQLSRILMSCWGINLGEMYWKVIDAKIDRLPDSKIEESMQIIRRFCNESKA